MVAYPIPIVTQQRETQISNSWLAAIVEHSCDAIYTKSLDGTITSWNKGAMALYGYSADEVIGRHVNVLAPPEHHGEIAEILKAISRGEVVEPEETVRVTKLGKRVYVSLQVSPLKEIEGNIVGASVIARDVTQQRETQIANSRLAAIVEASEDAIYGKSLDGTIKSWNAGAASLYGYSADEMLGRKVDVLVPPDRHNELLRIMDSIRAGQRIATLETVRVTKDGVSVYVSLRVSPVMDSEGNVVGAFMIARDITARKQIQRELARLAAIVESSEEAILGATLDGTLISWNSGAEHLYGYAVAEVIGRNSSFLAGSLQPSPVPAAITRIIAGQTVEPAEVLRTRKDGSTFHAALSFSAIRDVTGQLIGLSCIARNITATKLAEAALAASQARLVAAQEVAKLGDFDLDVTSGRLSWSAEMFRLMEFHPAEGEPTLDVVRERIFPVDRHESDRLRARSLITGEPFACDIRLQLPSGKSRSVHVEGHPIVDADGVVTRMTGVMLDITFRKDAEQQIKDYTAVLEHQKLELEKANAELAALATTDGLTGLNNHRAFQERLVADVTRAVRYQTPLSMILIDLDYFKSFNDSYGHPAGDDILRAVATVITGCTRDTDLVARYGGEEFVLLLPQTDLDGAAFLAERIRAAVEGHAWTIRNVTASIGVASLHLNDENGADIVSRADAALYRSKASGRNRVTSDGSDCTNPEHNDRRENYVGPICQDSFAR